MNEYLKAIYEIAVANNKFLVALEQRIINIENSLKCDLPDLDKPIRQGEDAGEETTN